MSKEIAKQGSKEAERVGSKTGGLDERVGSKELLGDDASPTDGGETGGKRKKKEVQYSYVTNPEYREKFRPNAVREILKAVLKEKCDGMKYN